MRCLKRNQKKMYFSAYKSKIEITDEWGNKTGEYENSYENPNPFYAYVSPEKGEVLARRFGEITPYDRVLVIDNFAPTISEEDLLWVDTEPNLDNQGVLSKNQSGEVITPHDYIVKKISRSLNSRLLAIRKVNVSD